MGNVILTVAEVVIASFLYWCIAVLGKRYIGIRREGNDRSDHA